jgi:hypothetical protein
MRSWYGTEHGLCRLRCGEHPACQFYGTSELLATFALGSLHGEICTKKWYDPVEASRTVSFSCFSSEIGYTPGLKRGAPV